MALATLKRKLGRLRHTP